jgi:hypothetical protein
VSDEADEGAVKSWKATMSGSARALSDWVAANLVADRQDVASSRAL